MSRLLTPFPWILSTSLSGFNVRLRTLSDTEIEGCELIDGPYNKVGGGGNLINLYLRVT